MMQHPVSVAIVGAGNVATHLAHAIASAKGLTLAGVFSRNPDHARALASATGTAASGSLADLADIQPDAVIVSVADSAMPAVASALPPLPRAVVAHTSGTVPKEILADVTPHFGVIYPLQTFSKDVAVDISAVPFFTEGSDETSLALLDAIAGQLSRHTAHADGERRKYLHIAGVLSCNFPNFLWEYTERILGEAGYGLEVVEPLVRATVDKAFSAGPHKAQTGPARRGDTEVMKNHADTLPDNEMKETYRLLSSMIMKSHGINPNPQ